MASILTTSISHIASQAVQTPRAAGIAGESQTGQNSSDISARVSQVAAVRAAQAVAGDKNRAVTTPKRVEAGFSSKEEKEDEEKSEETEEQAGEKKSPLHIIA